MHSIGNTGFFRYFFFAFKESSDWHFESRSGTQKYEIHWEKSLRIVHDKSLKDKKSGEPSHFWSLNPRCITDWVAKNVQFSMANFLCSYALLKTNIKRIRPFLPKSNYARWMHVEEKNEAWRQKVPFLFSHCSTEIMSDFVRLYEQRIFYMEKIFWSALVHIFTKNKIKMFFRVHQFEVVLLLCFFGSSNMTLFRSTAWRDWEKTVRRFLSLETSSS